MEGDQSPHAKFILEHSNLLSPAEYYRFIHLDGFEADWKTLDLNDDDLNLLQVQIMCDPLEPLEVPGTGGIRMIDFSPPPSDGHARKLIDVLYAPFPDYAVAVLAAASPRGKMEDLAREEKDALRTILGEVEDALGRGE
jgi:hypothetical protein